jgi:hypothetical protein
MPRYFLHAILLPAMVLSATVSQAETLLLCGMAEVFEIDVAAATNGDVKKLWSWRAADREELPEAFRKRFGTTDECKPIDGGKRVLISASSGGCALVERPSGRVLWYAVVPNAHSIEQLPGNRVVVAASVHAAGNRLSLFDLNRSETPIAEVPLVSAHGVVWDADRERLWALGLDELLRLRLVDWNSDKPQFAVEAKFSLPSSGGHDLTAVPNHDDLLVTTNSQVLHFDRRTEKFREHADLGAAARVKSVQVHPRGDRTVLVQSSDKAWWSGTLRTLNPSASIELPGERLYKARWVE